MHLTVAARGQYRWLWDWVAALSARYYPYQAKKDGPMVGVQLSVRPWQLFDIVFPEPCLKEVLSIVWPYDGGNTKPPTEGGGISTIAKVYKQVLGLSRLVGLKQIPYVEKHPMYETVNPHGFVGVTGIGLKKDIYHYKTGIEML